MYHRTTIETNATSVERGIVSNNFTQDTDVFLCIST